MNLLLEFIAYLLEMVAIHSIFVWGGQGQMTPTVCESWIRRREQDTGGERTGGKYRTYADIAVDFWKKQVEAGFGKVLRAFDCSGLVVYWLLKKKRTSALALHQSISSCFLPSWAMRAMFFCLGIVNVSVSDI